MVDKNQLAEVVNKLKQAKTCLILLPQNPPVDTVAAGLGAYLTLKEKKQIQIGCPTPMSVAYNRLFGVDKIKTKVGSKNLVISFPYAEESIEKVSYHVEGKTFNLVVVPKKGKQPLDSEKVSYSSSGVEADLVLVIGAQKWEDLGDIYAYEKEVFNNLKAVNIDFRANNTQFAAHNLTDAQVSSCSEIVAELLRSGGFPIKEDIATNLVAGIETATNNLQLKTTADTFSLLAWLLRRGGQRGHLLAGAGQVPGLTGVPGGARPPFPGLNPAAFPAKGIAPGPSMPQPYQPFPGGQPNQQPPAPVNTQPAPPISQETEATDMASEGEAAQDSQAKPSPDWFQPKIYKGNTRV